MFIQVSIILCVVAGIFTFFGFVWFTYQACSDNPDKLTQGHEMKSWKDRAAEQRKKTKFIGLILLVGTSAYMPIGRYCLEFIMCPAKTQTTLQSIGAAFSCKLPETGIR